MGNAANGVIERSRQIAAHMLKVEPNDVEFSGGSFKARGSGRAIGLFEVARAFLPAGRFFRFPARRCPSSGWCATRA